MAPPLDESTVRHVAHLARLELYEQDATRFAEQLSAIIGYVEQLQQLDTANVEPTSHALPISGVFRPDVARPGWEPDRALSGAPERSGGFIRVPTVFESEEP